MDDKITKGFNITVIGMLFYMLIMMMYTLCVRSNLEKVFLPAKKRIPRSRRVFSRAAQVARIENGIEPRPPGYQREEGDVVIEAPEEKPKKKKLAIPKYLMKLNDDFFASVTAKQVFLTKMDKIKSKLRRKTIRMSTLAKGDKSHRSKAESGDF